MRKKKLVDAGIYRLEILRNNIKICNNKEDIKRLEELCDKGIKELEEIRKKLWF